MLTLMPFSLTELQEMSKYTDSFYYATHNYQISDQFPGLLESSTTDPPEPTKAEANQERIKSIINKFVKRNDNN